jgi:putative DNA methylase
MNYHKKLIEVALPLEAINKACKDDKDRKTGHIRNFHKWYAPMPLPAWRAALFASLIEDPSEHAPEMQAAQERSRLFEVLERILPLDAAKSPRVFEEANEVLRSYLGGERPVVLDPFCGGGSTVLEAQRFGLRTIASDLNPIPVLITTVLTRYPALFSKVSPVNPESRRRLGQTHGLALVEDVSYYARTVRDAAHKELAQLFPTISIPDGQHLKKYIPFSWIWARTIRCPNPACGVETPLASSFELTRASKTGKVAHWIQPKLVTAQNGERHIEYEIGSGRGKPPDPPKRGHGAQFECVGCHTPIDEAALRHHAQNGGLGFALMACVARQEGGERIYLPPVSEVKDTVRSPAPEWTLDLELSTHPQYMGAPRYGMRTVGDLFTRRQLKVLEVFARCVKDIRQRVREDASSLLGERAQAYADAVTTILALCVSKLSQSHNVLVRWKIDSRNGSGKPLPAFDTQTIPMVWDFVENNPFGESVGDWIKTVVPTALRAFDFCVPEAEPTEVLQLDARDAAGSVSGPVILATDPPYYDNVPYADLSDVFYPLLRFILQDVHPHLFTTLRPPRSTELVADYFRHGGNKEKAQQYFLDGFRTVFERLKPHIRADTPITIVYSFKQQENSANGQASTGWEVMLRALLEAGLMVTATWPVRTTLQNRSRDIASNALASAILIICRPRLTSANKTTRRELMDQLQRELPIAVRRLQLSSIAPVDLQQAMIGPGMAVFSQYSEVIDAAGKPISVRDALQVINQILDEVLAAQEADFDPDTRWALSWFEQSGFADGRYGDAETLSKAKNTSVDGLRAAGIVVAKAGKVRLLRPDELPTDWDPSRDSRLTVWELVHHLIRNLEKDGESAAAEVVRVVGGLAETARELAYRLYTICERKKRTQEALSYNALAQSWPEVTRLAREGARTRPQQARIFS